MSLMSCFGQTFFIAIFGGEIRQAYGLTNGDWGVLYMIGTASSAVVMVFAGGLADRFRVRSLGLMVIGALGLACLAMAVNTAASLLVLVIFALRFLGQGMASHVSVVAMSRWFIAARGRALAVASLGFMLGEAVFPLTLVWLKGFVDWRSLWLVFGVLCFAMMPVLYRLLRLERTPQNVANTQSATGLQGRHWTRMQALRHPLFWGMVPAVITVPAFGTAFWFHQVHFAEIKGWEHLALVAVFPLGTMALALSTVAFGWAIDRFGVLRLLPFYLIPYTLGFVLNWYAPGLAWTAIAVILMGITGGGQATLIAACWSEFYGTRHIGAIKSAAAAVMVLGSAIGPGLSGMLIDAGVGFEVQQLIYAVTFALAALALFWVTIKVKSMSAAAP